MKKRKPDIVNQKSTLFNSQITKNEEDYIHEIVKNKVYSILNELN